MKTKANEEFFSVKDVANTEINKLQLNLSTFIPKSDKVIYKANNIVYLYQKNPNTSYKATFKSSKMDDSKEYTFKEINSDLQRLLNTVILDKTREQINILRHLIKFTFTPCILEISKELNKLYKELRQIGDETLENL